MLRWARGLVCMPCDVVPASTSSTSRRWSRRTAPAATPRSPCRSTTSAAGSGIGAADRAHTIQQILDPGSRPSDFIRPGHVFPLRARPAACSSAAVTPRPRSTSPASPASPPVAVICEVLHDDGSPARLPFLELFAAEHRIAMISVDQIAEHRLAHDDTASHGLVAHLLL